MINRRYAGGRTGYVFLSLIFNFLFGDCQSFARAEIDPFEVKNYVEKLENDDISVRRQVEQDLSNKKDLAIEVYIEALGSKKEEIKDGKLYRQPGIPVNAEAAGQLKKIGKPAVPSLIRALYSEKDIVRYYAAEILGDIGFGASSAIAALRQTARDANVLVRRKANASREKIYLKISEYFRSNLTKEKVIAITKEHALKQDINLKQYGKPYYSFDPANRAWYVWYLKSGMDPYLENSYFSLTVDDVSGEVRLDREKGLAR